MKKLFLVATLLVGLFGSASLAAQVLPPHPPLHPAIMTVDQVRPGMRGVGYTVFEGVTPEPFAVEILGVLKGMAGPKNDVILARLHGKRIEYTGVVAGMSGSPVYVDGKLLGALAYRIGIFSKEPFAGITPIQEMLEIKELDTSAPPALRVSAPPPVVTPTANAAPPAQLQDFADYLQPIGAPLVFNGFSEQAVQLFAGKFKAAGVVPVMGAGSSSPEAQPEPLIPGSAVSAQLIRGDMDVAATCTVTYVDPQRLLACGHPILNYGRVDLPMTKARVLATLPSDYNAFKIVNTTQPVGAFVQDRHNGILGRFAQQPKMIPVTISLHGGPTPHSYHIEVLNNPRLTPLAVMVAVFNTLQSVNEHGEDVTYRMQGDISVAGYPEVALQDMFAPTDSVPTAMQAALALGSRFGRIFVNPFERPDIDGVNINFDMVPERRSAILESARTDLTEARPGDEITIEAVLRPYRGERIVRQIPIRIPTSTPKGILRVLVSDGNTLDRSRSFSPMLNRKLDLGSTIAQLNKEHLNDRLYVSLLQANPQAMVEDKVMPALPLSVINVMEGMRGSHDMVLLGESAVDESYVPLDYVVSGAQVLTLTIK